VIALETALVISGVCLVAEAFFSGSEIAMVAANQVHLRNKAKEGSAGAKLALAYLDHPARLISTMLFGHNAAIVTAATVFTLAFIDRPGGEAAAVAFMTPVSLILAETVPKMVFQQNADALVPRIVYILRAAEFLFFPIIWVISKITGRFARLLGVEEKRTLITRDELRFLLEAEDEKKGHSPAIPETERSMIRSVLEFGDRTVYDVMVPLSEVTALPEDASIADAAIEIADKQHTRVPVYRERVDQIVGILMAHDVLAAEAAGRSGTVADLARPAVFVPEAKPTADLLAELQTGKQHLAVVVDEYGGATGICTAEDILEEIVGEIDDEYDKGGPQIWRAEGPGLWRVLGRAKIAQLNGELKISLPEGDDYESLAGLILEKLKRIPREGEQLRLGDITLTVVATTDRAIEEVRIRVARKK
jgi:CBS domain containing-hemolysin-like protein